MADVIWSPEAEAGLLGALLTGPAERVDEVRRILPDDTAIYREAHRLVYRAIVALTVRQVPLDPVHMQGELERMGAWDRTGMELLLEILDVIPTAASSVRAMAEMVQERFLRREVIRHAMAAERAAEDLTVPIADAMADLVTSASFGALSAGRQPNVTVSSETWQILEEVERAAAAGDGVQGVSTELPRLDELTDGWMKGRLIVIAARPKVGKSAFAVHCAEVAAAAELPVYFASAEMPRKQILWRRLTWIANESLRTGYSVDLWQRTAASKLREHADTMLKRPMTIDQDALTATAVRLGAQRAAAEMGGLSLIVVDYLGKLRPERKAERHDLAIGQITGDLARMAVDLDVPVLLLCQLNRASVKDGKPRRPTPADLRDSGSIEQDADQVVFLWQDPNTQDSSVMELDVALNRHGPAGRVEVEYNRVTGRWSPYHRNPSYRKTA